MQHRSSLHFHKDPDSLTNLNQHYSTPTQRRQFLRLIAMGLAGGSAVISETARTENRPDSTKPTPPYRGMGMPGPFPGKVVETKSDNVIVQNKVDTALVRKMMARGMMELTDTSTPLKAWQFFFNSSDVVGIKVNASGLPYCVSSPEILNEIIRSLHLVGIPSRNIYFTNGILNSWIWSVTSLTYLPACMSSAWMADDRNTAATTK